MPPSKRHREHKECNQWNYASVGPVRNMRTHTLIDSLYKDAIQHPSVEQRRYFAALGGDITCSPTEQNMARLLLAFALMKGCTTCAQMQKCKTMCPLTFALVFFTCISILALAKGRWKKKKAAGSTPQLKGSLHRLSWAAMPTCMQSWMKFCKPSCAIQGVCNLCLH